MASLRRFRQAEAGKRAAHVGEGGKCHRLFRVPAMFDMNQLGKLLIVIGLVIAAIGLGLFLSGKIPWFGRLPGDIVYRGKNVTFYFPLMTSLAVSVILTLILWFINRR